MKHSTSHSAAPAVAGALLLFYGIAAACIYILTDIAGTLAYPGFSYTDQAVSELFAIGAPTAGFVVTLFSLASALLLVFGMAIVRTSRGSRSLQLLGWMFALSALDALVLWNFFPMHMRGAERTFTDLMHLILASNPFVLGSLVVSVFAFRNGFRALTIAILIAVLLLSVLGFSYATAADAGEPTPGLGLIERIAQYIYQFWQVALAFHLFRRAKPATL